MKKRVGNDIKFDWTVTHGGVAEDFTIATGIVITAYISNTCDIITATYTRVGNLFHVTLPAADLTIGTYNTKITYQKSDVTISGGIATYTIDYVSVVQMVATTAAEDAGDISITSEIDYAVNGATFTPVITEVSSTVTNLSWTNDMGLTNSAITNIKGTKGDTGAKGEDADIAAAEAATEAANLAAQNSEEQTELCETATAAANQAVSDYKTILDTVAIEMILTLTDPINNLATGNSLKTLLITSDLAGLSLVGLVGKVAVASSSGLPTFTVTNLTTGQSMLSTALTINVGATNSLEATTSVVINPTYKVVAFGDLIAFNCTVAGTGTLGGELIPKFA